MERPLWMEEQIEIIIDALEKRTTDYYVVMALMTLDYKLICDCIEAAWKERSEDYCAVWLDVDTNLDKFIGYVEHKIATII